MTGQMFKSYTDSTLYYVYKYSKVENSYKALISDVSVWSWCRLSITINSFTIFVFPFLSACVTVCGVPQGSIQGPLPDGCLIQISSHIHMRHRNPHDSFVFVSTISSTPALSPDCSPLLLLDSVAVF